MACSRVIVRWAAWVVILIGLWASTAHAQIRSATQLDDRAKKALEAGIEAYKKGDFGAAANAYERGYEIDPWPGFLYALAQAHRKNGDCRSAITYYERFLLVDASSEKAVRANIDRCKEILAEEDGEEETIESERSSQEVRPEDVEVEREQDVVSEPVSMVSERADTRPRWYRSWPGHAFVAAGLLSSAIGFTVYKSATDKLAAVDAATNYGEFIAAQEAAEGASTRQKLGIGGMVMGVGLVATAVVFYVKAESAESRSSLVLAPLVGDRVIGSVLTGSF